MNHNACSYGEAENRKRWEQRYGWRREGELEGFEYRSREKEAVSVVEAMAQLRSGDVSHKSSLLSVADQR